VDSAQYVIACHRYIELNPVRAGMTASPWAYRWSSHNGNSGLAFNELLTPHAEYIALADDEGPRHEAYRDLFAAGDDPAFLLAIRDATNGGYAMISERLKSTLPASAQRRLERRAPGPAGRGESEKDKALSQLELGLGLRPRTG